MSAPPDDAPDKCPHCGAAFDGTEMMGEYRILRYMCGTTLSGPTNLVSRWADCCLYEIVVLRGEITALRAELAETVAAFVASQRKVARLEKLIEELRDKLKPH